MRLKRTGREVVFTEIGIGECFYYANRYWVRRSAFSGCTIEGPGRGKEGWDFETERRKASADPAYGTKVEIVDVEK